MDMCIALSSEMSRTLTHLNGLNKAANLALLTLLTAQTNKVFTSCNTH